jgi:hypothetical protein
VRWEILEEKGLLKVGGDDYWICREKLRDAETMVIMAVRAEDDILLLAIWIQNLIIVRGKGISLEVLAKGSERWLV